MTLHEAVEHYLNGTNSNAFDVYEAEHGLASQCQVVAHRLDIIECLLDCEILCHQHGADLLANRICLALRWFNAIPQEDGGD